MAGCGRVWKGQFKERVEKQQWELDLWPSGFHEGVEWPSDYMELKNGSEEMEIASENGPLQKAVKAKCEKRTEGWGGRRRQASVSMERGSVEERV